MNAPLPLHVLPHANEHMFDAKQTVFLANEYLYQQGEQATELYRVREGIVCLEGVNERGERCIFHLLGRDSVLGHEALLQQPRSFDVRSCTEAKVEVIHLPTTAETSLRASMLHWVTTDAARMLQDAARFKVELHRAQAAEKMLLLLGVLQKLQPEQTDCFWLPSRNEMADILDINHATASRIVARLFREGALRRVSRKDFVKVDWNRIRMLRNSN